MMDNNKMLILKNLKFKIGNKMQKLNYLMGEVNWKRLQKQQKMSRLEEKILILKSQKLELRNKIQKQETAFSGGDTQMERSA